VDADYWEKLPDGAAKCLLCPLEEKLTVGQSGRCHARENRGGRLVTLASGQPCVVNVDPIEKNPLAHVLPGGKVLSVAHAGCNLECLYCQNWEMALRSPRETKNVEFNRSEALTGASSQKLVGVNFTYTEPTTHAEFNRKLAAEAKKLGLRTFACTNGYVNAKPFDDLLEVLDGVTVTIKGASDAFYQKYTGAPSLAPVLESCKRAKASGKWIEIATLVIPSVNDGDAELQKTAKWIQSSLGPDTPWHIERFVPAYKMRNLPPTPTSTLERARSIGLKAGLRHVYLANVPLHEGNHTFCPRCKKAVVKRLGFKVLENNIQSGLCRFCRTPIPGIWS
jgi:pyruvate formate lyase activating enzyme